MQYAPKGYFKGAIFLLIVGLCISKASADDVPKITKEELNVLIDYTDVTIVDVRTEEDWEKTEFKIKTAVREDGKNIASWDNKHPKDKTIVLYCAQPHEKTSASLAGKLISRGYRKVYVLKGGWGEWSRSQFPVVKK